MIRTIATQAKRLMSLGILALILCSGLVFGWGAPAAANNAAGQVMQNRAEQELDRVAGAGTANQIEGRATEDLGRVQRQVGQVTNQTKGVAKQVEGRAQKDIGRTQSALENAADTVEDSTDNLVDSVKNFLGQ